MRKPRTQPAFATLTEAEIDQIADWLRHDTYDVVLERVRKPQSEGGFGLNISTSPLERLYKKTNVVDKINTHIASGEKLTVSALDAINAAEAPASEEVHDAIMSAAHELATSGDNTPTQLLALQRLADFPARAEIREERLQLDRAKAERASQLLAHKQEMDAFRKQIAAARLDLAERNFAFRQIKHEDHLKRELARAQKADSKNSGAPEKHEDHLGRYASTPEELSERIRKQQGVAKEEWASRIARNRELFNQKYNPDGTLKRATTPDVAQTISLPQTFSEPYPAAGSLSIAADPTREPTPNP